MTVIELKDIWWMYRIEFIIDDKATKENFWALKDISFKVKKGEALGIIGENGAGKSTVLKLIAGIFRPDRGEIKIQGRVSGLLELGAGFQPELTGKENIYLIASLFGLSQNQVDEKYKGIIDFADIGKFIHAPVKCYSQGMFVRLAFAVAIHMDSDILLIDDSLAVGDEYFQRKCIKKIFDLKEQGMTIIFVTHDMNMLNRLCERAIFLKEGKVIKDGAIDKVVPLYTQMMGAREKVGILEKEALKVVFNNGRFFLNWKDKILTPNSGAYAAFLIGDKWCSSLQADWEVLKKNESKLIATGKFYQLAMVQTWELELTDDYVIKWNIGIESQSPLEIQEGYAIIMLSDEYAWWFTVLGKGEFPPIEERDKDWRSLLEESLFSKCIGVKAKEAVDSEIPSLTFEQANFLSRNQAQILNTGYLTHCRVLQYKMLGLQNNLASQSNYFNYFSGKITLNLFSIEDYLKNIQDEFILSDGKLKLIFDNGKIKLSYDNVILTKSRHLCALVFTKDRHYVSGSAQWEVKKVDSRRLVARGRWHSFSAVQVWEIEVISEASFLWKIKMEINEETEILEQQVQFMCLQEYKKWFSNYGKGSFPSDFLEIDTDMLQYCIPNGMVGVESEDIRMPVLSLTFSEELNNFAKIFNSDFYDRARMLQVRRVEPEKNIKFLPGEYPYFVIQCTFGKDKENHPRDSSAVIEKEKLKVFFDKGMGSISWNGIELTKKLGLHTSVRSRGRWHDSVSSAIWGIEEKNKDTIKASSNWLHLPISQHWEIKLKENNLIELKIKIKVERKMEVERLQLNLLLSEQYSQWVSDKENGDFPSFRGDVDDDWECVYSAGNDSKYIGVSADTRSDIFLPPVMFLSRQLGPDWSLNIINSDIYHRGRLLQYRNKKKTAFSAGEYLYLSGEILIKV